MPDLDLVRHLRPGDTVVVGQATGEPPHLVRLLVDAAQRIDGLTAFCGYSLSDAWQDVTPGHPRVMSYAAHAGLRGLGPARLDILPMHATQIEEHVTSGGLGADVVLLQVGPPDADGFHDLGPAVDHAVEAARNARVVLVEVNDRMPRTVSGRRLHRSLVTGSTITTTPLPDSPGRPATEAELGVAANVASLVKDGALVQLGVGPLAAAVARGLRSRRGLGVRSGLVGDWLVDLHRAGALDTRPGSVVTGLALGSAELYEFLDGSELVHFAPISEQVGPIHVTGADPLIAINSALEVDLFGQLSSEVAGDRYVGAVGGQVDFYRAARRTQGGLAIAALASTTSTGSSRIVSTLDSPMVTSSKSDVDLVVTEWGVADIRFASLRERMALIAEVAHPDHRAALLNTRPSWL